MLWMRKSKPETIGRLTQSGHRIVVTCAACNTLTHVRPEALGLRPIVELSTLKHFLRCPECGYANDSVSGKGLLTVGAEEVAASDDQATRPLIQGQS